MKLVYLCLSLVLIQIPVSGAYCCAESDDLNLLSNLTAADLRQIRTTNAFVTYDPSNHSLALTFRYTQGDSEIRIPTKLLGWPTVWSQFKAVQYTFHSTSLETISIGFSDGNQTKYFITEPLAGIRIKGVIPFESFVQTKGLTPLSPLGYKVWPERLFSFDRVEEIVFRMRYPNQPTQLTLYNFTLTRAVPDDDILDKRPLIDGYGQWIPENWPDKAHTDEQLKNMWADDQVEAVNYPFCPLGGDATGRVIKGTGFFRTEKVEGRWVLLDPHGHPFFSAGMDLVGYNPSSFATDISGREYLFEQLPPDGPSWLTPRKTVSFYISNIIRRYGEVRWQQQWTKKILERLKGWGFNTIANWSDREIAISSRMPYVLPLEGWSTRKQFPFPYDFPDVFSKEFEENVEAAADRQCSPLKEDPLLIGWFIGNEPHWARNFGARQSWSEMVLADPQPSATQNKLKELIASSASPAEAEKIKSEFLYTCAQKYFEVIIKAIRQHDPHHLVLGIRFAGNPDRRWLEMSSMFDAFSINIYSNKFAPDPDLIRNYSEISGKPVLIGEFTAAAPGRGLQGMFYNVHKVRDQTERAQAYKYFVENSAANPYIIGTHWFQMVDDLPTGRPGDEERLNYGFINVLDLPYRNLVRAASETHRKLYDLKFGRVEPTKNIPQYN